MEVEIIKSEGLETKFILKDSSPAFANTLRRTILSEVPTLAIAEIIVLENTSPLYDEIVAHRLGLVPLVTPPGEFSLRQECDCNGVGCPNCEIHLELKYEGTKAIDTAYSKELKVSSDPDSPVKPAIPNIPILKLSKGQSVHIECIARLGRGRDHARWQPASTISYKYYPMVNIDQDNCVLCEECVKNCPPRILEIIDDETLEVIDEKACILCDMCSDTCQYEAIEVKGDDTRFIFRMSSTGALKPNELLIEAFKLIENIAVEVNSDIATLKLST